MRHRSILLLMTLLAVSCSVQRQHTASSDPEDELINTGYGSTSRKHVTGSISKINVEDTPTTPNMFDYLQGRVPGLYIEGDKIRIRGNNTIGNSEPLILVDDVETPDISALNPNEVASVEVLKDAASASIYGVRGANGVILITTKGASHVK